MKMLVELLFVAVFLWLTIVYLAVTFATAAEQKLESLVWAIPPTLMLLAIGLVVTKGLS